MDGERANLLEAAPRGVRPLPGLVGRRPRAVCEGLALSAAGRAALARDPAPEVLLASLLEAGGYDDALQFLAHALPRARAVGWACTCVRLALPAGPVPPAVARALAAAEAWARAPGTHSCGEAATAAQAAAREGAQAVRFAALGAAWSGDSLAPPEQPPVPPDPALGAAAVAAAVRLAAAGDVARAREFVARGILTARQR
jgi:hypothetical protein